VTPLLRDLWPPYSLRVVGARVELRLPDDDEIAGLAALAAAGVHGPDERPFLTPWTDGPPQVVAQRILRSHWSKLAGWDVDDWQLGLGIFVDGRPVGMITLRARDFTVVREVSTFSWLGLAYQGQGLGTVAREAALTLAFDHLDAVAALSEVFPDNVASQGVSRRLGYVHDGISRDARGDEALVSDRLRLTRHGWLSQDRTAFEVRGLQTCQDWFVRSTYAG
jgi:RimJ/RimL family protein N-acetyltransferase